MEQREHGTIGLLDKLDATLKGEPSARAVLASSGARQLSPGCPAAHAAARVRHRRLLPGADDACDVRRDAGLASGLVNTTAQVGGALGLAVLATLSRTRSESLTHAGKSHLAALTGGYHLAFLIASGLILAAVAVAVTVLQEEPRIVREADTPAEQPAYSDAA